MYVWYFIAKKQCNEQLLILNFSTLLMHGVGIYTQSNPKTCWIYKKEGHSMFHCCQCWSSERNSVWIFFDNAKRVYCRSSFYLTLWFLMFSQIVFGTRSNIHITWNIKSLVLSLITLFYQWELLFRAMLIGTEILFSFCPLIFILLATVKTSSYWKPLHLMIKATHDTCIN